MIKVLNLYAGIGGNRKLWPNDKIEVTAVELNPEIAKIYQDFFPNDKVIVGDAHQYLLDHYKEYDFIWSSPPCQSHSTMNKATRHNIIRYADMRLYQEIIFLNEFCNMPFVVENVRPYYEPLITPTQDIDRHLFWTNYNVPKITISKPKDFLHARKEDLMDLYNMHFEKNVYLDGNHCPAQILRNCVNPKLGLHIFNCAFKVKQVQLTEVIE